MTLEDIIATPATIEEILARLVEWEEEHQQAGCFLTAVLDHTELLTEREWHAARAETAALVASGDLIRMWPCAAAFADRKWSLLVHWPDDRLRLFWHATRWLQTGGLAVSADTVKAIIRLTLELDGRRPIERGAMALKAAIAEARGPLH